MSGGAGYSPQGGNIYGASSRALQGAGQGFSGMSAPGAFRRSMNSYASPYQENVLNKALGRIDEQRGMDLNNVRGQAAQAGAFGGSRHGLVESQVMDAYGRTTAETSANLYQQGFQTAGNMAQAAGQQRLASLGGLQGAGMQGFGLGQQISGGQAAFGSQQQQSAQGILDAGDIQYQQVAARPQQMLDLIMAGLGGSPLNQNVTKTSRSQPGMFDYLSLATGLGSAALGGK